MLRPTDHIDSPRTPVNVAAPGTQGRYWGSWAWRQLTSMRTALILLLLLSVAAIPGSLVPQRSSDPNGVSQYFRDNPDVAGLIEKIQGFDVYSSVWFSSIYLLLFVSLIGCIIPRTKHHLQALRKQPPTVPARLNRLPVFVATVDLSPADAAAKVESVERSLRGQGYRVRRSGVEISAERGYLRETGNLLFHTSLIGVLVAVGVGSSFGYTGQRVVIEGQTFINSLGNFDSFNPGRFFDPNNLDPYAVTLDSFDVDYEQQNLAALGQPLDYTATLATRWQTEETTQEETIKVNEPLSLGGTQMYLLGNGYAPTVTIKDPAGNTVFSDPVAFLPQDANLTSLGVIKIPDGLSQQIGLVGFFYPTQDTNRAGAFYSSYPDLEYPVLTFNVFAGDLGIDNGVPRSVYALDTAGMQPLTGEGSASTPLQLKPGETQQLPNGLGSITFDSVKRFGSFEVHHDPAQQWVLVFSVLAILGLLAGLLVPRRRVFIRSTVATDGTSALEFAGLARGDDPHLASVITRIADQ